MAMIHSKFMEISLTVRSIFLVVYIYQRQQPPSAAVLDWSSKALHVKGCNEWIG